MITYPYRESLTDAQVWGLLRLRSINWDEVSFVKASRVGETVRIKLYPKHPDDFVCTYVMTWGGWKGKT